MLDVTVHLSDSGGQKIPLRLCFMKPGDRGLLFNQLLVLRNRDARCVIVGQVASCWSVDVFIDVQIMEAGEGVVSGSVSMLISLKLSLISL